MTLGLTLETSTPLIAVREQNSATEPSLQTVFDLEILMGRLIFSQYSW
jgi:hypothetical protein